MPGGGILLHKTWKFLEWIWVAWSKAQRMLKKQGNTIAIDGTEVNVLYLKQVFETQTPITPCWKLAQESWTLQKF